MNGSEVINDNKIQSGEKIYIGKPREQELLRISVRLTKPTEVAKR